MNKNFEAFRNNVFTSIQQSGLEVGAIYYIMKDIIGEVEREYSNAIRAEMIAENEQMAARQGDEAENVNTEAEEGGVLEDEAPEL